MVLVAISSSSPEAVEVATVPSIPSPVVRNMTPGAQGLPMSPGPSGVGVHAPPGGVVLGPSPGPGVGIAMLGPGGRAAVIRSAGGSDSRLQGPSLDWG